MIATFPDLRPEIEGLSIIRLVGTVTRARIHFATGDSDAESIFDPDEDSETDPEKKELDGFTRPAKGRRSQYFYRKEYTRHNRMKYRRLMRFTKDLEWRPIGEYDPEVDQFLQPAFNTLLIRRDAERYEDRAPEAEDEYAGYPEADLVKLGYHLIAEAELREKEPEKGAAAAEAAEQRPEEFTMSDELWRVMEVGMESNRSVRSRSSLRCHNARCRVPDGALICKEVDEPPMICRVCDQFSHQECMESHMQEHLLKALETGSRIELALVEKENQRREESLQANAGLAYGTVPIHDGPATTVRASSRYQEAYEPTQTSDEEGFGVPAFCPGCGSEYCPTPGRQCIGLQKLSELHMAAKVLDAAGCEGVADTVLRDLKKWFGRTEGRRQEKAEALQGRNTDLTTNERRGIHGTVRSFRGATGGSRWQTEMGTFSRLISAGRSVSQMQECKTLRETLEEGATYKDCTFGAVALRTEAMDALRVASISIMSESAVGRATAEKRVDDYMQLVDRDQYMLQREAIFPLLQRVKLRERRIHPEIQALFDNAGVDTSHWSNWRKEMFVVKMDLDPITHKPRVRVCQALKELEKEEKARFYRTRRLKAVFIPGIKAALIGSEMDEKKRADLRAAYEADMYAEGRPLSYRAFVESQEHQEAERERGLVLDEVLDGPEGTWTEECYDAGSWYCGLCANVNLPSARSCACYNPRTKRKCLGTKEKNCDGYAKPPLEFEDKIPGVKERKERVLGLIKDGETDPKVLKNVLLGGQKFDRRSGRSRGNSKSTRDPLGRLLEEDPEKWICCEETHSSSSTARNRVPYCHARNFGVAPRCFKCKAVKTLGGRDSYVQACHQGYVVHHGDAVKPWETSAISGVEFEETGVQSDTGASSSGVIPAWRGAPSGVIPAAGAAARQKRRPASIPAAGGEPRGRGPRPRRAKPEYAGCWYCGSMDHYHDKCPENQKGRKRRREDDDEWHRQTSSGGNRWNTDGENDAAGRTPRGAGCTSPYAHLNWWNVLSSLLMAAGCTVFARPFLKLEEQLVLTTEKVGEGIQIVVEATAEGVADIASTASSGLVTTVRILIACCTTTIVMTWWVWTQGWLRRGNHSDEGEATTEQIALEDEAPIATARVLMLDDVLRRSDRTDRRPYNFLNWEFLRRAVVNFEELMLHRHEYKIRMDEAAYGFVSYTIRHAVKRNRRVLISESFMHASELNEESDWHREFRCGCPGLAQCQRAGAARKRVCLHCGLVLIKALEESQLDAVASARVAG